MALPVGNTAQNNVAGYCLQATAPRDLNKLNAERLSAPPNNLAMLLLQGMRHGRKS
jgi:hypothetical protein